LWVGVEHLRVTFYRAHRFERKEGRTKAVRSTIRGRRK
jgi:hypothetical protein